ncbi:G2/M phase-specific E3 ubiquitin-protein ligase-like [Pecten maximus]|uniref:G2/M phase-specific E3 ubiquitin-protein ligase-like n=1 Tax=Pecten maximus TaxID=6579 RepID=UPI0014590EA1|nr:G2/M phase-specific E3 ubiquitin-protein ligase-like [Pecten maximus]
MTYSSNFLMNLERLRKELEEGIDQGGPKREYFCLVMEHLLHSHLFEGPPNSRIISMNKAACDNNHFLAAGRLIALSIVHGGPAPHCFSPLMVHALQFGPKETKLLKARTETARSRAMGKLEHFFTYAGIPFYNCSTQESVEQLVKTASHSYMFDRTSEAFRQFRQGLDILKVGDNIKSVKWTQDNFEDLFQYQLDEPGSNSRVNQAQCIAFWRDYLEEVEEETVALKFSQILQFCTGAKEVPPLGFSPQPTIAFWDEKYPKANTCANTLVLPTTSKRYKEFVGNIEFGILNAQGFLIE